MKATSERIGRTERIKEALKNTSGADMKRAIAIISLDLGITKAKTEEYIELFKDAGYIKTDPDNEKYHWIG